MFMAHSGIRYLVLLFGVACALYALFGLLTRRPYDRGMRMIASMFAGTIHLQILLGVVVIFTRGFYPALMGHIMTMVIAAAVAQLPVSVMKRRPADQRSYAPHAMSSVIALALIWAGVAAIGRSLLGSAG